MKKIFISLSLLLIVVPSVVSAQQFIPFLRWTNATGTNATTTNFHISNQFLFGGVRGDTWDDFCVSITGSADLCDGDDSAGAGGGISWPFTKQDDGVQATSTTLGFFNGFLSLASSTNLALFSTNNLLVNGSSTLQDFTGVNATTTNATTTELAVTGIATAGTNRFVVVRGSGNLASVALPLTVSNGGTGAVTLTGCLTGNGTGAITGNGTCAVFNWPFTKLGTGEQATSTTLSFSNGFLSTASSTITASTTLSETLLTNGTSTNFFASNALRFDGEILPDGLTCSDGQILKKTGADNWDCATDETGAGGGISWPFTKLSTNEQATSTIMAFLGGFLSTGSTTINTLLSDSATTTNATSTTYHVSSGFSVAPLTSALLQTNTVGTFAEYAGTSCTNQFVRALSALGVATCATVGSADVDLADLTATDTTLTFSGTYDGQTARTIGLNLTNANTWTGGQTFGNASTTNLNVSGNAISFGSNRITATTSSSFRVASSTLDTAGASYNRATTTLHLANWPERRVIRSVSCMATSTGGVIFHIGDGTNFSTGVFCDNLRKQTVLNYTLDPFEDFVVMIGKASSTPHSVTITASVNKLSD